MLHTLDALSCVATWFAEVILQMEQEIAELRSACARKDQRIAELARADTPAGRLRRDVRQLAGELHRARRRLGELQELHSAGSAAGSPAAAEAQAQAEDAQLRDRVADLQEREPAAPRDGDAAEDKPVPRFKLGCVAPGTHDCLRGHRHHDAGRLPQSRRRGPLAASSSGAAGGAGGGPAADRLLDRAWRATTTSRRSASRRCRAWARWTASPPWRRCFCSGCGPPSAPSTSAKLACRRSPWASCSPSSSEWRRWRGSRCSRSSPPRSGSS
ncbi:unnamed protein product [Prorocentrum cordatum]|uniref:Protein CASP n=1 Tax=Prorocentrum cordatum TaxID=2364126 RepID=A0ABN9U3W6_9DINO|nr:unnamed protein product [Polarella glacialis]